MKQTKSDELLESILHLTPAQAEFLEYILSLTPAQIDRIMQRLSELQLEAGEGRP